MTNKWKKSLLIGGCICLIFATYFLKNNQMEQEEPSTFLFHEEQEEKPLVQYIYVDIKGAVEEPGVYKMHKDSRLFQAIDLAGGLRSDADGDALNLSMILKDQDVIYVPDVTEEYPIVIYEEDTVSPGGVININLATIEELQTLPGIGPSTAQKIIDYRSENGVFATIEEIINVSGIGETTYNNIKDFITV